MRCTRVVVETIIACLAVSIARQRSDIAQTCLFFEAFLKAALRLDALALRVWLRRRLKNPSLAAPIDPARFTISDADIAALLNKLPLRADDADGTGL
jgi:hypothetical protein